MGAPKTQRERQKLIARVIVNSLTGLVVVAFLAYPLDWAVWRVRMAFGSGMGMVQVTRFTVAELKGSKEEYYVDGNTSVDCSKSLLPEAGSGACWWLERHTEVVQKY